MTREQQRKFKELNKSVNEILAEEVKKYHFKKKSGNAWYNKGELFFSLSSNITQIDGHCYCSSLEQVKPLYLDDLFWDIVGASSNKKEPMSLRCVGAWTVQGAVVFQEKREIITWERDELQTCIADYMDHFNQTVQSSTMDDYRQLLEQPGWHGDIRRLVELLHEDKYREAKAYIKTMEHDDFQVGSIGFRKLAQVYIVKKKVTSFLPGFHAD